MLLFERTDTTSPGGSRTSVPTQYAAPRPLLAFSASGPAQRSTSEFQTTSVDPGFRMEILFDVYTRTDQLWDQVLKLFARVGAPAGEQSCKTGIWARLPYSASEPLSLCHSFAYLVPAWSRASRDRHSTLVISPVTKRICGTPSGLIRLQTVF